MATFSYSALKPDGSISKGELTAADRADAFRRLGRNGLQPVSLEAKETGGGGTATATAPAPKSASPKAEPASRDKKETAARSKEKTAPVAKAGKRSKAAPEAKELPSGPVKLKRAQVVLFTEELSDLLGAGLQLEPALRIMENREELSNLKVVAGLIRQQVRDGASFSAALRNASPSFGELYCSLAQAGEVSGALSTILRRQATYLIKLQELQSRVIVAMIYPACLLVAVVAVSIIFVSFLMPQLVSLLESMGQELPLPAKILLGLTGVFQGYWWAILLVVIAGVMIFKKMTSTPPYDEKWHERQLSLPLLGGVFSRRFYVQFLETLGNLVGNGLTLLKGLELTQNATMNLYGKRMIGKLIEAVGEGAALSRTMRKYDLFPSLLIDMISVGEQTGDLPTALNKAAERYDKELEKQIERVSALMQPVVLAILAAIVAPMAYIMINVIIESLRGIG